MMKDQTPDQARTAVTSVSLAGKLGFTKISDRAIESTPIHAALAGNVSTGRFLRPDTIVYLSGPMTGLPAFNRPAFNQATADLEAFGLVVINPARIDLGPAGTWEAYMRHALRSLSECEAVVTLPGWEASRGAKLEVHIAHQLSMRVHDLDVVLSAQW